MEKGHKLWENLLELEEASKNDEVFSGFNSSILELINKAMYETEKSRSNQILEALFMKIWKADENLAKFLSHLINIYKSVNILKRDIENTQAERQKEVWSLIKNLNQCDSEFHKSVKSTENRNSPILEDTDIVAKACDEPGNFTSETTKIMKIHDEELPYTSNTVNAVSLQNTNEVFSVIEDNNLLRYRIQEVQQSCYKTVKEIASLNWEFLLQC